MISTERLCMGCMNDNGGEQVCPICGFDAKVKNPRNTLTIKTLLNDRFLVGRVLSANGEICVEFKLLKRVSFRRKVLIWRSGGVFDASAVKKERLHCDGERFFVERRQLVEVVDRVEELVDERAKFENGPTRFFRTEFLRRRGQR